jgi:hypothetical protein
MALVEWNRMASLEDRGAIKMLTGANATCGYSAAGEPWQGFRSRHTTFEV